MAGNDTYVFTDNSGTILIDELAGEGNDTLDFSLVTVNLTFNINGLLLSAAGTGLS